MKEKLTILGGGMLRYRYCLDNGSSGMCFDFNTLAEVGAPYQSWFKDEIAARGLVIEFGRFLDTKPYVADFVIKSTSKTRLKFDLLQG